MHSSFGVVLPSFRGSRDGAMVEHSPSTNGPGFDSRTRRHKWVEFVGSLSSAPTYFSPGTPVSSLLKN